MLIDKICQFEPDLNSDLFDPEKNIQDCMSYCLSVIKQQSGTLHKFKLTNDFVGDPAPTPKHIIKIKDLIRLPFPQVWMEIEQKKDGVVYNDGFFLFEISNRPDYINVVSIALNSEEKLPEVISFSFSKPEADDNGNASFPVSFPSCYTQEDKDDLLGPGNLMGLIASICDILGKINSPRITIIKEKEDFSKLNRSRIKSGKEPLHEYHIVDLRPEIKLAMLRDKADEESCEPHRKLHWRRGHYKIRKTGMFWWNAHVAGSATLGVVKKHYEA